MKSIATAREKMLAGETYLSPDPELGRLHVEGQIKARIFNSVTPGDRDALLAASHDLFGRFSELTLIKPPVTVDYGIHVEIGDRSFVNMGCTFLDCNRIVIGNQVAIGTGCQFLTVNHPVPFPERILPWDEDDAILPFRVASRAEPIVIEDRCWLGAGVIVLPGVTIGEGAVIGAGSVVTRDIPPGVVAAGNPCRILRKIED